MALALVALQVAAAAPWAGASPSSGDAPPAGPTPLSLSTAAAQNFTPYSPSAFTHGVVDLLSGSNFVNIAVLPNVSASQAGTFSISLNGSWNPNPSSAADRDWVSLFLLSNGTVEATTIEANSTLNVTLASAQVPFTCYFGLPSPVPFASATSSAQVKVLPPGGNLTSLNLSTAAAGINVSSTSSIASIPADQVWFSLASNYSASGVISTPPGVAVGVPLDASVPFGAVVGQARAWSLPNGFPGARFFLLKGTGTVPIAGTLPLTVWTRGSPESGLWVNASISPVNTSRSQNLTLSGVAGNRTLVASTNWTANTTSTLSTNRDSENCNAVVRLQAGGYRLFCNWVQTVLLISSYGVDSAYSPDGFSWSWEAGTRLSACGGGHTFNQLSVVRLLNGNLRMYYGGTEPLLACGLGSPLHTSSAVSTDEGLTWSIEYETLGFGVSNPDALAVVPAANGSLRMYLDSGSGLRTATSDDGVDWTLEGSTNITAPRSVYALSDGSFKEYYGTTSVFSRTSSNGITWGAARTEVPSWSGNIEAGPLIDGGNGTLLMLVYSQSNGLFVVRQNATAQQAMALQTTGTLSRQQAFGASSFNSSSDGSFSTTVAVPAAASLGRYWLTPSAWFGGPTFRGLVLNRLPAWTGPATLSATEDQDASFNFSAWAQDPDSADTVSANGSSAYGTMAGGNLTLLYPNGVLTDTAVVTLTDGFDIVSFTLSVSVTPVNDQPTFNPNATYTVTEDTSSAVDFAGTFADEETASGLLNLSTNASGATVNGSTITFAYLTPGNRTVRISVDDGVNVVNRTVTIVVLPVNDLPLFSPNPVYTVLEDSATAVDFSGTYSDEETATALLNLSTNASGAAVNGSVITFLYSTPGNRSVRVTVDDGVNFVNRTVTIVVTPVNDRPFFNPNSSYTVLEDSPTAIDFGGLYGDEETPAALLNLSTNATGAAVNGSRITFLYSTDGNRTVTVGVDDGLLWANRTITIIVIAVDDPPAFTLLPLYSGPEDQPITLNLSGAVSDEDTPLTLLTITTDLPGATVTGLSITFTWPVGAQFPFNVTVHDGSSNVTKWSNLTVIEVNDPPTIALPASFNGVEDQPILVDLAPYVGDEETPVAGLSILTNLTGATVAGLTISLTWPVAAVIPFNVTVSDGQRTATAVSLLLVAEVNDPPTIALPANFSGLEDSLISIDLTAFVHDEETPTGGLQLSTNLSGATISTPFLNVTWPVGAIIPFNVTVSDGTLSATATSFLFVTEVNDRPTVALDPDYYVSNGSVFVLNLSSRVADEETPLSLTLWTDLLGATVAGLEITYAAQGAGDIPFTVRVDDGALNGTASSVLHVTPLNRPPRWTSAPAVPPLFEDVSQLVDLLPYVADDDNASSDLTFSEDSAVASLQGTQLVLLYPNNWTSDAFNLTVSDGLLFATITLWLNITPVNDAPALLGTPGEVPDQNGSITFQFGANDIDDSTGFVFLLGAGAPDWVVLSPQGALTIQVPSTLRHGRFAYTVQVEDASGAFSTARTFYVVLPENHLPIMTPDFGNLSADATPCNAVRCILFTLSFNVSDEDGDPITLRAGWNDSLQFLLFTSDVTNQWQLRWSPIYNYNRAAGEQYVNYLVGAITLNDTFGESRYNFTFRVMDPPDSAPRIGSAIGPFSGDEGSDLWIPLEWLNVTDTDALDAFENLTWTYYGDASVAGQASLYPANHTLHFQFHGNGTANLTLRVWDGSLRYDETTVSFTSRPLPGGAPGSAQGNPFDPWSLWWLLLLIGSAIAAESYRRRRATNLLRAQLAEARAGGGARRPFVVEDVFLLFNDGRTLFTRGGLGADSVDDPETVGAMLIAVQDFVKDSFHKGDLVDRMGYGDNLILIERGEHTLLAVTVFGEPDQEFRELMKETLRNAETTYAGVLEGWSGDRSQMAGVEGVLAPLWGATASLTRGDVILANTAPEVQVLSGLEFFQGYVRVKVSIVNNTPNDVESVRLSIEHNADVLRLSKIEPATYKTVGARVSLGAVKSAEKVTVAFYLDPQICTSSVIEGKCTYVDEQGQSKEVKMKPRRAEVVCPLFFTKDQANTAMLRRLIETELNQFDVRAYGFGRAGAGAELSGAFESMKAAVLAHDVQLVRSFERQRPYVGEAWFYGTTQKGAAMVIRAAVDQQKGRAAFFVASTSMRAVTGLLAELHHTFSTSSPERPTALRLEPLFDESVRQQYSDPKAVSKMVEGEAEPGET